MLSVDHSNFDGPPLAVKCVRKFGSALGGEFTRAWVCVCVCVCVCARGRVCVRPCKKEMDCLTCSLFIVQVSERGYWLFFFFLLCLHLVEVVAVNVISMLKKLVTNGN